MGIFTRIKRIGVKFEKSLEHLWQRFKVNFRLYNEDRIIKGKIDGCCPLTKEEKRLVRTFYSGYFKPKLTSHQFYKEKTGLFRVEYIPDYIWYSYIDPYFNDWKLDKYIDNKCYYHRIFPGIKMPVLHYYRLNGFWYDGSDNIVSEKSVKTFLEEGKKTFFLKKADSLSGCGYGVTAYNPQETPISQLSYLFSIADDMVVQEAIAQHPQLSAINESSVNTVRILSLMRTDGTVKVYSSVLRIGRRGKKLTMLVVEALHVVSHPMAN